MLGFSSARSDLNSLRNRFFVAAVVIVAGAGLGVALVAMLSAQSG